MKPVIYKYITTAQDNLLSIFYNPNTNLLVIDLIDEKRNIGNELVRITLNETLLLSHKEKTHA